MKQFHRLTKVATQLNTGSQIVKAITNDDQIVEDENKLSLVVTKFYSKLY